MGIGTEEKAKYNPLSEIRVVVDTGPLLHLMEAGCLDLLPVIGSVEAPDAVLAEMQVLLGEWDVPTWLSVSGSSSDSIAKVDVWYRAGVLGRGESEAIALALESGATWLLTDDAEARLVASGLGVEVHGSVGVVPLRRRNRRTRPGCSAARPGRPCAFDSLDIQSGRNSRV